MAAINVKRLNGYYKEVKEAPRCIGTGAPADTDVLATNVERYPVGTEYIDTAAPKLWKRVAAAGLAADFVGVALA